MSFLAHEISGNIKIASTSLFTIIDTFLFLRNAKTQSHKTPGDHKTYRYTHSCNSKKRLMALGSIMFLRDMLNLTHLFLTDYPIGPLLILLLLAVRLPTAPRSEATIVSHMVAQDCVTKSQLMWQLSMTNCQGSTGSKVKIQMTD